VEKDRVSSQICEVTALDYVAYLIAGDVGLEERLDSRNGSSLRRLSIGDEFGKLFFQ